MEVEALIALGDNLFGKRGIFMTMCQEIAENFYPERADFTASRTIGDTWAQYLTTSYPLLVRRDLGNSFGTMLRPNSIDWFHMRCDREEYEDQQSLAWMQWASGTMRRAMYDRSSMFTRASKEGDHDLAAFGQCVKSVELNGKREGLLYRCWHIRDCAWVENAEGKVDTLHRKWKPSCAELCQIFGNKVHTKVGEKIVGPNKQPYDTVNCRHIVMPADCYNEDYPGKALPYVSIFIDVDNKHVMEAVGRPYFMYIVPRWQTVSGSQYAYSPAAVAGLPDARLLQAMTSVLLEAGEKAVNPPLIAAEGMVRSDMAVYAGGVTWVDAEYDERLGEVLRPITQDKSGIPVGLNMAADIRSQLTEAFYINKLSLPQRAPEMTAYEVGQRVQDYIRNAAPIFEPLEHEDNGAVCETTFELMMINGAFGSVSDIPQAIRGKDIVFRFESPLHDAIERQKGTIYTEAQQIVAQTLALDPTCVANLDIREAFRDVLSAIGVPAKWMKSEEDAAKGAAQMQQQMAQQQMADQLGKGAQTAQLMGQAGQSLKDLAA